MNKAEKELMKKYRKALDIAADLFYREGYVAPNGDGGPAAIRRYLLRKAKAELSTLTKTEGETA